MSRIPLIEKNDASGEVSKVYNELENEGFSILNVFKMFANNDRLLKGFKEIVFALYQDSNLEPRYRELAYLRASQLNSCHY